MRRWPWILGGVVIAATIVTGLVLGSRFGTDPNLSASPLLGRPVPAFSVTDVDTGATWSDTDLEGSIGIVNFWASWCVPCRAEHGALVEVARRHDEVSIIGIVYQDTEGSVHAFLDELGRGYPAAFDERSRAAIAFGVRGVPETYFVSPDGTVVGKVNGPVDLPLLEETIAAIASGELRGAEVTSGTVQRQP